MKYFDTHVHFFPDQLAGKALPKLREPHAVKGDATHAESKIYQISGYPKVHT